MYFGKPADVWAAGGSLFYFIYGRPPFSGSKAADLKKKVQNDE